MQGAARGDDLSNLETVDFPGFLHFQINGSPDVDFMSLFSNMANGPNKGAMRVDVDLLCIETFFVKDGTTNKVWCLVTMRW